MNLIQLIKAIENNPDKFLQDDCVFQLMAFIRGFIVAKNLQDRSDKTYLCDDHILLDSFIAAIRLKYNLVDTQGSLDELLTDIGDEGAFDLFFAEWNDFIQTKI